MSISAFPKIFQMADKHVVSIWEQPIEVTEKLDGSQFAFGLAEGELFMRSKGSMLYDTDHFTRDMNEKDTFYPACMHVLDLKSRALLLSNTVYYGETLRTAKHNTLTYGNTPLNHIALFGVICDGQPQSHDAITFEAGLLEVGVIPLIFEGHAPAGDKAEWLSSLLENESYLGKSKIEGVVIKSYSEGSILSAKYVSEAFKETHRKDWNRENTSSGVWNDYKESFKTEARWNKAIQHLRDDGLLEGEPGDIGALIKEISRDITEEEQENIMRWLWSHFKKEILRTATNGFPEYYKRLLLEESLNAK